MWFCLSQTPTTVGHPLPGAGVGPLYDSLFSEIMHLNVVDGSA